MFLILRRHVVLMLPVASADSAPLATPGPLVTGGGKTFLMCPARLLPPWGSDLTGVLVTNLEAWN